MRSFLENHGSAYFREQSLIFIFNFRWLCHSHLFAARGQPEHWTFPRGYILIPRYCTLLSQLLLHCLCWVCSAAAAAAAACCCSLLQLLPRRSRTKQALQWWLLCERALCSCCASCGVCTINYMYLMFKQLKFTNIFSYCRPFLYFRL